jgi:hypothetical protein
MESTGLRERVLKSLEDRREKVLKGDINCIPLPFPRFREEFPGIEQGKYYLLSGATKSSKTQLANYLILYNTILYMYYNPGIIKAKIFYYNLEETAEAITLRFMSYLLYILSDIRISPSDLRSTNNSKPLDAGILELLNSKQYVEILNLYEEVVQFMPSRNPTGVYKDLQSYAKSNGVVHKKMYTYKDEFGVPKEAEGFDYYSPNDSNEYVFVVIDHISLLETEKGMTLRECINKLSEYMIILRNRYNYIPVVIQQQGLETTNLEAFKSNKIRPTTAGLSDSKYTAKDCDVMLGITNPFSHELPEYLGYDIKTLRGNFRCLEVVLNRSGQSNGICPLYFDGAINFFKELPKPTDSDNLKKVYNKLNTIRDTKTFFAHSIIKSKKELHNRKQKNKFATLLSKLKRKQRND